MKAKLAGHKAYKSLGDHIGSGSVHHGFGENIQGNNRL